jgi:hypothetical protein
MSLSISEQSFQYIGILNGVMYRIDPLSGRSVEPMDGYQPLKTWSDYATNGAHAQSSAALQTVSGAPAVDEATVAAAVPVQRVAAAPKLFPRSGAEPLRAGHSDLWALLVAGTCLEGSSFSSL